MTLRLDTEQFIQGLFIDIKSKFKTQRKYGVVINWWMHCAVQWLFFFFTVSVKQSQILTGV